MNNLDDIVTQLWILDGDIVEDNLTKDEIRENVHQIVNRLEEIVDSNDLWNISEK